MINDNFEIVTQLREINETINRLFSEVDWSNDLSTAAQFLKRFIGDTKWAHLDIAGVAWKGKGDPLAVKGATGYGLRLLNQLVKENYEK